VERLIGSAICLTGLFIFLAGGPVGWVVGGLMMLSGGSWIANADGKQERESTADYVDDDEYYYSTGIDRSVYEDDSEFDDDSSVANDYVFGSDGLDFADDPSDRVSAFESDGLEFVDDDPDNEYAFEGDGLDFVDDPRCYDSECADDGLDFADDPVDYDYGAEHDRWSVTRRVRADQTQRARLEQAKRAEALESQRVQAAQAERLRAEDVQRARSEKVMRAKSQKASRANQAVGGTLAAVVAKQILGGCLMMVALPVAFVGYVFWMLGNGLLGDLARCCGVLTFLAALALVVLGVQAQRRAYRRWF
jgi:hypothetical protein